MQISNISQVSYGLAPKQKISIWSVIMVIVGNFFTLLDDEGNIYNMGKFFSIGAIGYIVCIIIYNYANTERYLHIIYAQGVCIVFCVVISDF